MNFKNKASQYLKNNPVESYFDVESSFDNFLALLKSEGGKISECTENEWFEISIMFGYIEDHFDIVMSQVSSWGIDD